MKPPILHVKCTVLGVYSKARVLIIPFLTDGGVRYAFEPLT